MIGGGMTQATDEGLGVVATVEGPDDLGRDRDLLGRVGRQVAPGPVIVQSDGVGIGGQGGPGDERGQQDQRQAARGTPPVNIVTVSIAREPDPAESIIAFKKGRTDAKTIRPLAGTWTQR